MEKLKKVDPLDIEYLKLLEVTLAEEWLSNEDDEAYDVFQKI